MSYSQLQEAVSSNAERLAFIDFKLRFTGMIRRSDIKGAFGLAEATASRILTLYSELRPNNFYYNRAQKVNVLNHGYYEPLIPIDSEMALGMLAHGFNKNKFIGKQILPYVRIGRIPNSLDVEEVSKISRAIYGGFAVECCYISSNSCKHDNRTLVPLAILNDGKNWIFRAYDRSDREIRKDKGDVNKFKNFNFSRAVNVNKVEGECGVKYGYESLNEDTQWNHVLPLALELHYDLTDSQKKSIRKDFGMPPDENNLFLTEKAALIWILTKKWNIDTGNSASENSFFQFKLKNKEMIQPYL